MFTTGVRICNVPKKKKKKNSCGKKPDYRPSCRPFSRTLRTRFQTSAQAYSLLWVYRFAEYSSEPPNDSQTIEEVRRQKNTLQRRRNDELQSNPYIIMKNNRNQRWGKLTEHRTTSTAMFKSNEEKEINNINYDNLTLSVHSLRFELCIIKDHGPWSSCSLKYWKQNDTIDRVSSCGFSFHVISFIIIIMFPVPPLPSSSSSNLYLFTTFKNIIVILLGCWFNVKLAQICSFFLLLSIFCSNRK